MAVEQQPDPDRSDMSPQRIGRIFNPSPQRQEKMRRYSPYGTKINFITMYLPTYNGYEILR